MNYSIREIAEKLNMPIPTLRYYDKEGLLPFVERSENGRRVFSDRDIILLHTIRCLKATGMPLKAIKQYVDWCAEGFATVPQRYELIRKQKQVIGQQMVELQKMLDAITYKCQFYENALKTGSTEMCDTDRTDWANHLVGKTTP